MFSCQIEFILFRIWLTYQEESIIVSMTLSIKDKYIIRLSYSFSRIIISNSSSKKIQIETQVGFLQVALRILLSTHDNQHLLYLFHLIATLADKPRS
jgi:hypothetical protein